MNNLRNWTDDFNLDTEEDIPCMLKKSNSYIRMKEELDSSKQDSEGILQHYIDDPLDFKTKIPDLYSNPFKNQGNDSLYLAAFNEKESNMNNNNNIGHNMMPDSPSLKNDNKNICEM